MLAYKPVPTSITSSYDLILEARMNAYEIAMNQRCNYLRRFIPDKGWIQQIEETVRRKSSSGKFKPLIAAGLLHYSWEIFVIDHPALFSKKCVDRATYRVSFISDADMARCRLDQQVAEALAWGHSKARMAHDGIIAYDAEQMRAARAARHKGLLADRKANRAAARAAARNAAAA